MSDPRKHHFVAQTYQRGFARRKGKAFQVRVLNKRSGEGGIRNVRDAFSQRDWNTIKTDEGLKEFGVERVLAVHRLLRLHLALDKLKAILWRKLGQPLLSAWRVNTPRPMSGQ